MPNLEDSVSARLDADRRALLDLSLRNPLLNYRPRSRGLEFVGESAAQVFRLLVGEGKRMTFLAAPGTSGAGPSDASVAPEGPGAPQLDATINASQTDLKLQTDLAADALQARLLSIHHAARTSIEEQGVNTLFLVPGMLRWFEPDDRERKRPLRAPLLLVPVELERSSARERFRLIAADEEPEVNLSLVAKLRADFAIDLADLPDAESDPVDDEAGSGAGSGASNRYLDAVAEAVRDQGGWEVERETVVLGFFSFGKFLMYRDLDEASWPVEARPGDHPVVGALLGDGFREPPSTVVDDAFLDDVLAPDALHQVVDADSSQLLAILDVSRGRNLLIQGPPGTGKSQTITNLIAEAIGRGKTVLFVAEKLAALEVVKRRLDAVGLGAACLELHSHKTRKRGVLDELRRTLALGRPKLGAIDDDLKMLAAARDRLNAYCDAVNTPIASSGVTPYQAQGALLRLRAERIGATPIPIELDLDAPATWTSYDLRHREAMAEELQSRLAVVGLPRAHPFWGSRRATLPPTETERLRDLIEAARGATSALRAAAGPLAASLRLPAIEDRAGSKQLLRAAARAAKAVQIGGIDLADGEWTARRAELHELLDAGSKLEQVHAGHDDLLVPEAWDEDVRAARQALNGDGRHWWRLVSPGYRRAMRTIAGLCRAAPPRLLDDQLAMLDAVAEASRRRDVIRRHEPMARRLFGLRWQGERSHWTALTNLTRWTWRLHHDVRTRRLPAGLIAYLADPSPAEPLRPMAAAVKAAIAIQQDRLGALARALEFDHGARFGPDATLDDLAFDDLEALLQTWSERLGDLPPLVGFNHLAHRCREAGMATLVAIAETWPEASRHLVGAFRRHWNEGLLSIAFATRPALAGFDGAGHERAIATFADLDRRVLRHNRARLAFEHWQRLPRHEGGGQLAVLRREFEKKSRHMPLRTLLGRAGNAVRAIKPVFLMSPLSVASYLAPGGPPFDLVVFDEASQVRPVDALGALLRGRQAVVVGDSRQLPPTRFFDRLTGGDAEIADDDEPATSGDLESVLGLFAVQGAPERMLRWHYRSRHESLIAVANREFYDERLVVFPSPDADRRDAGLALRHVPEAVYDRGRTRTNPVEAGAVARAVLDHAREQIARPADSRLTLGVAAFSMAQGQAIQDRVERMRHDDPACEPFFATGGPEPFFVKNLESVQGDERDVIFISVGYGRTADGDLAMSFGPLNGDGGERRLNVLITRARLRCVVFTGLTAEDIDDGRSRARGVAALKTFLAYAEGRPLVVDARDPASPAPETAVEAEPDFDRAIAAALTDAGCQVRARVGNGASALDLAIVDPVQPGRYRMGLACDGPSDHAPRSARDRDRLRPQVLQSLGWRLRRVWSTDWLRNPDGERERLLDALAGERPTPTGREPGPTGPTPTPAADRASDMDSAGEKATEGPSLDEPYERESEADPDHDPTPSGFTAYEVARLADDLGDHDLGAVPIPRLAERVAAVVAVESPVHVDEVARRIADAAGVKRLGSRLLSSIESACDHAQARGTIRRRGDFLWQTSMHEPTVRDRGALPPPSRKLELIAPEEVARAVEAVVVASLGIESAALPAAVGRALGFARIGDDFRDRVESTVRALVEGRRLSAQGEQVVPGTLEEKLTP